MEVRQPVRINQAELFAAITKHISEHNPLLQAEFDFTLFNAAIEAANSIQRSIQLEGDQLFKCECVEEHGHVDDCPLKGLTPYTPSEKYKDSWQQLLTFREGLGPEQPISFTALKEAIGGPSGKYKALISESMEKGLFERKDEMFYRTGQSVELSMD